MMLRGINAGFGNPLMAEFAGLEAYAFQLVRQDLYAHQQSVNTPVLVAEFVDVPLVPLFLIGGGHIEHADGSGRLEPHELAAWVGETIDAATQVGLTNYLFEIGNEPDLAHPDYAEHPEDFAEAIRQCHETARGQGFFGPIVSGGISNLNERGFQYLADLMATGVLPHDMIIGFHRYPESGRLHLAPHQGFYSREEEWELLKDLTHPYQVACTEFGYSTFTEQRGHTRTDAEVAMSVLWDLRFYEERSTTLAAVYQLNDGPTDDAESRYGVRAFDGTWKLVAEAIRQRYGT